MLFLFGMYPKGPSFWHKIADWSAYFQAIFTKVRLSIKTKVSQQALGLMIEQMQIKE